MTDPDLIALFIRPLERLDVQYMITGGVASVIYGDPRFTRDIDVVLTLPGEAIRRLLATFDPSEFYVPPEEALTEETRRPAGGHFNVIHRETALRADVYLSGDDPLHAWAFQRRRRIDIEGQGIWVAPVEYVVLRKLEYFLLSNSDRHLRDVSMMLQVSGDQIDAAALAELAEHRGLSSALQLARAFDQP